MSSRLLSNVKFEFGGRVVHVVVSGILLVFLTRVLGPEGYGLFALAIAALTISRLFSEFGLPWSAARYVVEHKDDDPETAAAVVAESRTLVIVFAAVVSISLVALSGPISSLVGEPRLSSLLVVGSGIVFFYTLHSYNRHVLQGYEDITASAVLHTIEGLLTLVLVVGLVVYDPTPSMAILGYGLGYGLAAALGFVAVRRTGSGVGIAIGNRAAVRRKILRYSVPLTVTRLSEMVDRKVDVLLVGFFINPTAVAFYTLGKQISQFATVPAASIGFALSPTYGSQKSAGNVDSATAVFQETLEKTLALYVPAAAGLFVLAETAIPVIFGAEYVGAVFVVQIMSIFLFFAALSSISNYAIDYLGRARSQAALVTTASTGNFVLNLALIPPFGAAGAAIASVITTGFYAVGSTYIMYTELPFDLRSVARSFATVVGITALMVVVVVATVSTLSGFLALGAGIGAGVAVWLVGCHYLDVLDVRSLVVSAGG